MNFLSFRQFLAIVSLIILASAIALYKTMFDSNLERTKLVKLLRVYDAHDQNGPLQFLRLGRPNDGGYVVPIKALETSDVLMGYGIANDASFEMAFAQTYQKPSYGFDCGVSHVPHSNKLFTFINECIGNDKLIYTRQISSHRIASFSQQLQRLHLENKKIFIKMDIEGTEYEVFDEILKHASQIQSIVLEIHFNDWNMSKANRLLSELSRPFVLLHVHGNNYTPFYFSLKNVNGRIPQVLELSYINKSLITTYALSKNQSHPLKIDMPNNPKYTDAVFNLNQEP